jgi:hypothetical protein
MKYQIAISLFTLLSINMLAQNIPQYSNFNVKVENKTAKAVNLLSHIKANKYRTNLKNAFAKSKVNFAGKYILTQWGCGTACIEAALIDVKTGTVLMPIILTGVTQGYNPDFENHEILEFKNNSNLLIIYGSAGYDANKTQEGISYYEWTGNDFKLLKFIPKSYKL